ncbi:MAG TPA: NAD(P)/FAD-dependent oxidoreductase [Flavihumibacter sp.]|nr:NAD(P)/FAD-dependent oxidoreductase [Flavihumibacter sp.]
MANKTLLVIGGGAAGFFCAVNAARMDASLRVILLEKTNKLLSKVRVSGGGRCNVTHACFRVSELVKKYPRGEKFLQKSFTAFSPADTMHWFEERGVPLKTETDGRVFPVSDDSAAIVNCLLAEADRYKVDLRMGEEVKSIQRQPGHWEITSSKASYTADCIFVATGGFPKAEQFNWLTALGHTIEKPVPSLYTFNLPRHSITTLMGLVAPDALVKIAGTKLVERGPLLVTHWGMSGPVILRLSAWGARELAAKNWHFEIVVNWTPTYNENSLRLFLQEYRQQRGAQKIRNKNPFELPQRLWEWLLAEAAIDAELRWADLPAKAQNLLAKQLTGASFSVQGKTTFKEEFVTAGGIVLREVDPLTMQSRLQPGLYFGGEVLDVDGITGGFNFQHAWTSGWVAAQHIAACPN